MYDIIQDNESQTDSSQTMCLAYYGNPRGNFYDSNDTEFKKEMVKNFRIWPLNGLWSQDGDLHYDISLLFLKHCGIGHLKKK